MNVAVQDQLGAATADVERHIRKVGVRDGWRLREAPGPVVTRIVLTFAAEATVTCEHLASPAPCIGDASDPGRIYCARCYPDTAQAGGAALPTCDGCNRYSRRLSAGACLHGPLLVIFRICPDCQTAEQGDPTNPKEAPR